MRRGIRSILSGEREGGQTRKGTVYFSGVMSFPPEEAHRSGSGHNAGRFESGVERGRCPLISVNGCQWPLKITHIAGAPVKGAERPAASRQIPSGRGTGRRRAGGGRRNTPGRSSRPSQARSGTGGHEEEVGRARADVEVPGYGVGSREHRLSPTERAGSRPFSSHASPGRGMR